MSNYSDTIVLLIVDLETGITMTIINWDDDDKTNSEDYPWWAVTRSEALASLRPRAKTRTAAELSTHQTALHTSIYSPLLCTHLSLLTTALNTSLSSHSPLVYTHISLLTTTSRTSFVGTIPVTRLSNEWQEVVFDTLGKLVSAHPCRGQKTFFGVFKNVRQIYGTFW